MFLAAVMLLGVYAGGVLAPRLAYRLPAIVGGAGVTAYAEPRMRPPSMP